MRIGSVTLDNDLVWTDEFAWTPTAGTAERALDGHLSVQVRTMTGGRPLTLAGGSDNGWQSRTTVIALQTLADSPDEEFTVELADGRTFTAAFRIEEQPVLTFAPVALASAPEADFWYTGTVNLRIV